jgi:predicted  nucleic acid-binding Zn-ribbon protein
MSDLSKAIDDIEVIVTKAADELSNLKCKLEGATALIESLTEELIEKNQEIKELEDTIDSDLTSKSDVAKAMFNFIYSGSKEDELKYWTEACHALSMEA